VAVLFLPPVASAQNIVIVVIDDAGIERFGTYAVDYQLPGAAPTPTIDALASTGVRFDNFWAYPVCSPFRASLLTGVDPWSHGVSDVIFSNGTAIGLDPEQMNLAHMLSNEGYRVEAFGKWHVAGSGAGGTLHDVRQHPISSGFHLFDGSLANSTISVAEPPTPNVTGYFAWERCSGTSAGVTCQLETTYSTTYITDAGITCVQGSEPFLCYVAYHAAHMPFHDPPAALHSFDGQCDLQPDDTWGPPEICHKAMIEALDSELARLSDEINFSDTTLFVVSDNGTMEEAADGPYPANHNKFTVYQGGLNTPLIVKGQAVTVAATTVEAIVQTTDIFAAVADIAGSSETTPDSVSLLPYLTDPVAPPQRNTVMAERFLPSGLPPMPDTNRLWLRASREECYKLIWNFEERVLTSEFFNLCDGHDPYENSPLDSNTLTDDEIIIYETLLAALRDPDMDDEDEDGLTDGAEINLHGTDPFNSDSDNDGLNDGDEVNVYLTDPLNPDTDGDGFNDGEEVSTGFDPKDSGSTPAAGYDGSLILHTLANDQTIGAEFPFDQKFFIARPLGATCNPENGGVTCGSTTLQEGAPLIGSGIATRNRLLSPHGFALPLSALNVTATGSLPQYSPYNYISTYASGAHNENGFFGPGFGPGKRTVTFSGSVGPGARVAISPGVNQFGGTMRLLGALGAKRSHSYKNKGFVGTSLYSFEALGSECTITCYVTGAKSNFRSLRYQTAMGKATTAYITTLGLPWTTGAVSITATAGPFPTLFRRTGYDHRTAKGLGTIQLVAPQLVRWEFPDREGPWDRHTGAIGILRIKFVPEPASWRVLVAGSVFLGLLYRRRAGWRVAEPQEEHPR
jgi:arylsulfatase A-like enzyme